MKITIEKTDALRLREIYTIEVNNIDVDIDQLKEIFGKLAFCLGFQEAQIAEMFGDEDEYKLEGEE